MGHRQLALIFALISGTLALVITALCFLLNIPPGVGVIASIVLFNVTSFVQINIAKKRWELDYKNAFMMLLATSIPCAIIYTFGYQFIEIALMPEDSVQDFHFWPFFFGCILFRLPLDAIAAIFHKK